MNRNNKHYSNYNQPNIGQHQMDDHDDNIDNHEYDDEDDYQHQQQ